MKEFKPIAMRCNQQQYGEISQILLNNECKIQLCSNFSECPYLINNYCNNAYTIGNTFSENKTTYNRTVFETWNKDIFLEYCGIKTKTEYKVGDWVVVTNNTRAYGTDQKEFIGQIDKYENPSSYWIKNHNLDGKYKTYISICCDNYPFRKAEPHEIPNNQITAEEALERFKDIQIGDEYMSIKGNRYIANTLPKIMGLRYDEYYIDCGSCFLWKSSEPDKFGYKINKQNSTEINAYPLPPNPIIANKQLIKKIQPIQLIRKKKIVMDTKINPIKSINTNLKIKNQKLWI